jgi:hypothetical protein
MLHAALIGGSGQQTREARHDKGRIFVAPSFAPPATGTYHFPRLIAKNGRMKSGNMLYYNHLP